MQQVNPWVQGSNPCGGTHIFVKVSNLDRGVHPSETKNVTSSYIGVRATL